MPSQQVLNKFAHIEARAQQSRFHAATLNSTSALDIDLQDVDLTVGERELVSGARVHLKSEVKYGLVGRNETGKSTLLVAIAERMIPGIPPSIRIVHVSQLEEADATPVSEHVPVIRHVLDSHLELKSLLDEQTLLERAQDAGHEEESQKLLNQVLLQRAERSLVESQSVALRRSGARGKKAREAEIAAEEALEATKRKFETNTVEPDASLKITSLLSDVQLSLEFIGADTIESRTRGILRGLGFSDEMIDGPFGSLSGGWRSRCRLALALLIPSDVLLLDEPSNFLDLESSIWLQHHLRSLDQTIVIVSHDRSFLDAVSDETMIIRQNKLEYFPGTPTEKEEAERKERLGKVRQQAALDKKKEHIEASIAQGQKSAKKTGDDNRLRMVKSRSKKLNDRWGNETSAKGTRFKLNRDLAGHHFSNRDAIEIQQEEPEVRIKLPEAAGVRGGHVGSLLSLEGVEVGFGKGKGRKVVLEGADLVMGYGETVVLVGRNGQGKSTLAKLILGELQPTRGTVKRHPALKTGYFDQHTVESLPTLDNITSLQIFLDRFKDSATPVTEQSARRILGGFGLGGRLASHTPLKLLSGGQKVRLALALLFHDPPNFLILDEVSTHLDFSTIKALSRELRKWQGGLLLVTHDRYFCNVITGNVFIDSEDESPPIASDDECSSSPPRVYLLRKKGMRLLEGGMDEYESIIERRLLKRGI
ncbi:hypothetical protein I350_04577 [Cryptococcus amylolentus CBS 6273]|uniref:ABC transporter domain-containing protein n=1 Tax=Cryptococcus amylolentus CBS 6273 TaxID=1296118 RepID=A0A1E3JXN7_9TREE|nr:hypothetical protein I350_04577 [Cryptococcus amylolentus CBS 6273]